MITSQRTLTSAIVLVIAASLTVSLSGCFSNPLENFTDGLIEGTVEKVIEGSTGIDVDGDGTGGSLPDSWPAEVPVPDGAVVFSLAVGRSYTASITVGSEDNAKAGYEKFLASGYEMTSEVSLGEDTYAYGLQSDDWIVQYSWGQDSEGIATVNISAGPTGE
ncbi:hypothetical protein [Rhodoglobus aureus]|uniref:Secreted protein n=1 Tax=Rhodoglobus aureus TaxID=191497 RepID=A0ABN1VRB4_9MICO